MTIKRSTGDTTAVRIEWEGAACADLEDVTAVVMNVYDTTAKVAPAFATLIGETRGFDPATYFPVDGTTMPAMDGTKYAQIVLTRGAEDQPLPDLITWTQG